MAVLIFLLVTQINSRTTVPDQNLSPFQPVSEILGTLTRTRTVDWCIITVQSAQNNPLRPSNRLFRVMGISLNGIPGKLVTETADIPHSDP